MSAQRKELVWKIKKNLFRLSSTEVYEVVRAIGADHPGVDQLNPSDEESCIDHILDFMHCRTLLESEDEGFSHLLSLSDAVMSFVNKDIIALPIVDVGDDPPMSTSVTQNTHSEQMTTQAEHTSPPTQSPASGLNLHAITQPYTFTSPSSLPTNYHHTLTTQVHNTTTPISMQPHNSSPFVSLQDLAYFQRKEFRIHGGANR